MLRSDVRSINSPSRQDVIRCGDQSCGFAALRAERLRLSGNVDDTEATPLVGPEA
jgi:hypothetical protein